MLFVLMAVPWQAALHSHYVFKEIVRPIEFTCAVSQHEEMLKRSRHVEQECNLILANFNSHYQDFSCPVLSQIGVVILRSFSSHF